MKIAITGHTKGIGKAIADLYTDVIGFSRSNGYDISNSADIDRIIAESANADIFINNAYHNFSQCEVLDKIFQCWKNDPTKTIVNINSRARYGRGNAKLYNQAKMELYTKAKNLMFSHEKQCRIITISPGYVKTDAVNQLHGKTPMLTPEQLATMIKWCLDQPQGVEIGELSVWCTAL